MRGRGQRVGWRLLTATASATALVALVAPTGAAGPTEAAAAAAATPNCTKVKTQYIANGWYLNTPGYDATRGSSFNCYLEYGDNNAAVRWLQYSLSYCNTERYVIVNGRYGTDTRDLVRGLQSRYGLPATGIYGPLTRSKLHWRLYNPKLKVYSQRCYSPV